MRSHAVRYPLALLAVLAPAFLRRFIYRRLFGYRIAPTAVIGRAVVVVDELDMAPGSVIAHLNLIRGCRRVQLGENAVLGPLNWINGVTRAGAYVGLERDPSFVMGREAHITSLHMFDCSDLIEIGEFCSFGGMGTQVLTHSGDILGDARQHTHPVRTGPYSFIGTRCTILAGVDIAERAVVGAGSVVLKDLPHKRTLYGGNPAKAIRELPEDTGWFTRTSGYID